MAADVHDGCIPSQAEMVTSVPASEQQAKVSLHGSGLGLARHRDPGPTALVEKQGCDSIDPTPVGEPSR